MTYESGFRWVTRGKPFDPERCLALMAPSGQVAATVYFHKSIRGHVWFVWDEDGVGGENSSEETMEAARITAESAVLRWGQHFICNEAKPDEDDES